MLDEMFKWLVDLIIRSVAFQRDWKVKGSRKFWALEIIEGKRIGGRKEFIIQERGWRYITRGTIGWVVGDKSLSETSGKSWSRYFWRTWARLSWRRAWEEINCPVCIRVIIGTISSLFGTLTSSEFLELGQLLASCSVSIPPDHLLKFSFVSAHDG